MKMNTLKAAAVVGLTALLVGSAAAQESKSKPVGYETITFPNGFSYAGLRLHEAPVASGEVASVPGGATVTVADGVADALADGTSYIFEVTSGDAVGAVVTVDSFDADADTITLSDDLSDNFADADTFTIRPAATLATVFGADNSAGIDAGSGGTAGADQIWVPNATGGFDKYYYDGFNTNSFTATWTDGADGSAVTAADIAIIYTDGLIILGAGTDNNTFVVSGSVKLTGSSFALASGFNYISSVSPAGGTLASMFDPVAVSGLVSGSGGTAGADQVWVPAGGGFDKYYYDSFNTNTFGATWTNSDNGDAVDATAVSLDDASGLVILNPGADKQTAGGVPEFYSTL